MDEYVEPVFRPPSEAGSLILQLTVGCSHNRCVFCPMYKDREYRVPSAKEFQDHMMEIASRFPNTPRRVFLADGDALSLEISLLKERLGMVARVFPGVRKMGIYGSAFSLKNKSVEDLRELRSVGLRYVYLGIESGDEQVLAAMGKPMAPDTLVKRCRRVTAAGLALSVTLVAGLGGKSRWVSHAAKSASVINRIVPTHTALLKLMTPYTKLAGETDYRDFNDRDYRREAAEMVRRIEVRTSFRADHVSNPVALRGILPRDRERILADLEQ